MGNSNSDEIDSNFNPNKYQKSGLTREEIVCIRRSFLQFEPSETGFVSTKKILRKY